MRLEHTHDQRNRPSTNGSSYNGSSPHTNGSSVKNGAAWEADSYNEHNGAANAVSRPHDNTPFYGHDREEVTRILIQSLADLGYRHTANQLSRESGYEPEMPGVAAFRTAVLRGAWEEAEALLLGTVDEHGVNRNGDEGVLHTNGLSHTRSLSPPWRKSRLSQYGPEPHAVHSNGLPLAPGADVSSLKFLMRQQKYLELLETRDLNTAMSVLRNELTPLGRDTGRIHSLSSLLMCQSAEDLRIHANWDGAHGTSRSTLLSELSRFISPSVMIPEHRLASLFSAVQDEQVAGCRYHNTTAPPSLYTDHECSPDEFPLHTMMELQRHSDEIWYLEFSHDGTMLATAGKDGVVCVYDTEQWSLRHEFREHERSTGNGNGYERERDRGICHIAFSPDDRYLISCSICNEFVVLNVSDGRRVAMADHFDYPVTAAAWLPDSQTFVISSQSSQRPLGLYSLRSSTSTSSAVVRNNESYNFRDPPPDSSGASAPTTSFRVSDCAVSNDGSRLAATTPNNRLLIYDLLARRQLSDWLFDERIISVKFAPDNKQELLVSMTHGRVLTLSAITGETIMSYEGVRQEELVVRSTYGGATNHLIVSGSEDSTIRIWRRESGCSVAVLEAHSPGSVNCVAWHPTNPAIFASAGDDRRVRIWSSANAIRSSARTAPAMATAPLDILPSSEIGPFSTTLRR